MSWFAVRRASRYGQRMHESAEQASKESGLLRDAAKKLGWTQYRLGQEAGVSQSTVSYVLAGERLVGGEMRPATATNQVFAALCEAMEVPLALVEELRPEAAELIRGRRMAEQAVDAHERGLRTLSDDELFDLITNAVKEARRRAAITSRDKAKLK